MDSHSFVARAARVATALAVACVTGCTPALVATYAERFVEEQQDGLRDVNTVVVIDSWWIGGRERAERTINRVSATWEREFGIRFPVVEVREEAVFGPTALQQVGAVAKRTSVDADHELYVVFSQSTGLFFPEAAEVLGNYLVIAPGPLDQPEALLSHALGHIFGASHRVAPTDMMSLFAFPLLSRVPILDYSEATRRTVERNKWRSFARSWAHGTDELAAY